tara:strand:- start:2416 stop:2955 length:540 start_codon:yes stop_codon:yes gene_type:complete
MKFNPVGYWEGQVAPNQTDNDTDINGHGFRYKVRILFSTLPNGKGVDSVDATIKNKDLKFASVVLPPTHGSGNRLTCGLRGGEFVCGNFLDNEGQYPRITGIIPRSVNEPNLTAQQAESQETTYGTLIKTDTQTRSNSSPTARPSSPSPAGDGSVAETGVTKDEALRLVPNARHGPQMA